MLDILHDANHAPNTVAHWTTKAKLCQKAQCALHTVHRREEEGGGVDETHNPFVGDEKLFDKRAGEMQKRLTRRDGSTMSLAQVSSGSS